MNREQAEKIKRLESNIGYIFTNKRFLQEALTHASYSNEQHLTYSNERMEFLGDAVLHLVLTEFLMAKYRSGSEGQLSALRSYCESEPFLYATALEIDLGAFLYLGKGEENAGGRKKESVLSDAFEALLAAIYQDGGYLSVTDVILALLRERIIEAHDQLLYLDSKSELQKISQQINNTLPRYELLEETGPEHEKEFIVRVSIDTEDGDILSASGKGPNKRAAEKEAARNALYQLSRKSS